jgi:beta-glucanase (GH16 family)
MRVVAAAVALATVGSLAQAGGAAPVAVGATASSACSGETPPPKTDGAAWSCTFDDEFDGTALGSTWTPTVTSQTGVATGAGKYQACYVNSTNNISVSNGTLRLTVRKERQRVSCDTSNGTLTTYYTAGSVSTIGRFAQTYGRFEVRAKLPDTAYKGLEESLWMWPVNAVKYYNDGPAWCEPTGEIDFAEFYSAVATRDVPYMHYCFDVTTVDRTTGVNAFNALPPPDNQPGTDCTFDYTQWNTFTLDWQPGVLTVYVNDKTCMIDYYEPSGLTSPAPFDSPFFLALSQELGVTLPNSDNGTTASTMIPATTQIDYVRVWQ